MVYVFLADGFEEVEALTPVDYLRRAGIEVVTVGVSGKTVVGARKIPVVCDTTQDKLSAEVPEAVILPGGIPGVPNLLKSSVVADTLEKTYRAGGLIAPFAPHRRFFPPTAISRERTPFVTPAWKRTFAAHIIKKSASCATG